jgi:hypothetical protein
MERDYTKLDFVNRALDAIQVDFDGLSEIKAVTLELNAGEPAVHKLCALLISGFPAAGDR